MINFLYVCHCTYAPTKRIAYDNTLVKVKFTQQNFVKRSTLFPGKILLRRLKNYGRRTTANQKPIRGENLPDAGQQSS